MSTAKKKQSTRMWESFFKVCSSPSFEKLWKEFLVGCAADALSTVYQHVTNIVFKDLLIKQFPAAYIQEVEPSAQLDYNQKNALRYVSGTSEIIESLKSNFLAHLYPFTI